MEEKQVAILIDGDNISSKYADTIKQEALQYGNIKVFRLYGSISSPSTKKWYPIMPMQGIMPILQISYVNGKSIADQALTIDAMDFLYSDSIDIFCIASSDSDFTKLVYRLKESGKIVIGMGESKTKEALAKACDEFKILDLIYQTGEEDTGVQVSSSTPDKEYNEQKVDDKSGVVEELDQLGEIEINIPEEEDIVSYICSFIDTSENEKVNLAVIGNVLKKRFSGFDARNYKYSNMTKMLKAHNVFNVIQEDAPDGIHKIAYISLK